MGCAAVKISVGQLDGGVRAVFPSPIRVGWQTTALMTAFHPGT